MAETEQAQRIRIRIFMGRGGIELFYLRAPEEMALAFSHRMLDPVHPEFATAEEAYAWVSDNLGKRYLLSDNCRMHAWIEDTHTDIWYWRSDGMKQYLSVPTEDFRSLIDDGFHMFARLHYYGDSAEEE